jgi:Spy/CpxP family protein refolding chaperone
MKNRSFIVAATAALVPFAGAALAGDGDRPKDAGAHGTFKSMDTDADGRISRTEASADQKLGNVFSQADANGDGYLDNAEYDASHKRDRDTREGSQRSSDEAHSSVPGNLHPSDANAPQTRQPAGNSGPTNQPDTSQPGG